MTLTPQGSFFGISPMGLLPVFFQNEPSIFFVRMAIITVALAVFALGTVSRGDEA